MFNNNVTSDLMLPILLDTANLIRRAIRPGKEPREVKYPQTLFQRRSFTEESMDDDMFDTDEELKTSTTQNIQQKHRNFRTRSHRTQINTKDDKHAQDSNLRVTNNTQSNTISDKIKNNSNTIHDIENDHNVSMSHNFL